MKEGDSEVNKMIEELNIRPFQAILSNYYGFSWLKQVVLSLSGTTAIGLWLVIKVLTYHGSNTSLIYHLQREHPIHAFLF